MTVTVLGIRHHGPGSARSLVSALGSLEPDCVLVEGPSEADGLISLASHEGMRPPVALLVYDPQRTSDAGFFPFAVFSPEWQAILYALEAGVPVRFMDLPYGQLLALRREQVRAAAEADTESEANAHPDADEAAALVAASPAIRTDPIGALSTAAGEPDGERWWDRLVESRRVAGDVFEAIAEAMTAVRSEIPDEDPVTSLREAAMRRSIRAAEAAGHERIAVVCGAWHVPALIDRPPAAHDTRLLKTVPAAAKVSVAWVPWTYERLSADSGYGAGIPSPGWYEHLWSGSEPLAVTWMARVARTFRAEDLDISPAHLIEATRLAETLAALRGRSIPSLDELTEAIRTVVTLGSDVEMAIVRDRLIVGRAMGRVPDDVPIAPLAGDLAREERRLRLRPEEGAKTLDLDLRGAIDLDRSRLLHRLRTLDVPWGSPQVAIGKTGTFHEIWSLAWKPEFVISLIAMSRYGATIPEAASARVVEVANASDRLAELTGLVEAALLADIPDAVEAVVDRIGAIAAVATDVPALMAALPPLARVVRYGNVRGTDAGAVVTVVAGFVERIAIGLPGACATLDDDAAAAMVPLIVGTDAAISLLNDADQVASWRATLALLQDQAGLHGLVAGRVCRVLLDDRAIDTEEATRRMRLALSRGSTPAAAASWVEGFLGDSGTILLHDEALFGVLDAWVTGLAADAFEPVLPLLRRTVATFPAPERRALGERLKRAEVTAEVAADGGLDPVRADAVLPILALLLGVDLPGVAPTAAEPTSETHR
jgi:hypothetical protein